MTNQKSASGCALVSNIFSSPARCRTCCISFILPVYRVENFAEHYAVQLNDTHPSIGVAELMRLLIDERQLVRDKAWAITVQAFGYTDRTLLPEALETWPLPMLAQFLPRHLEIIYEINRRFPR